MGQYAFSSSHEPSADPITLNSDLEDSPARLFLLSIHQGILYLWEWQYANKIFRPIEFLVDGQDLKFHRPAFDEHWSTNRKNLAKHAISRTSQLLSPARLSSHLPHYISPCTFSTLMESVTSHNVCITKYRLRSVRKLVWPPRCLSPSTHTAKSSHRSNWDVKSPVKSLDLSRSHTLL